MHCCVYPLRPAPKLYSEFPTRENEQKENQSLRQEREAAEASMLEMQQKAIRAQEDMAVAMRTRPTSSSSAPNLPSLAGGAARQAGAEADARWVLGEEVLVAGLGNGLSAWLGCCCWWFVGVREDPHDQWCWFAVVLWHFVVPSRVFVHRA